MQPVPRMFTLPQLARVAEGDPALRFRLELEFVESLADPHYLEYLARDNYFSDQAFVHYLDYLQYFKRPEYVVFIRFALCVCVCVCVCVSVCVCVYVLCCVAPVPVPAPVLRVCDMSLIWVSPQARICWQLSTCLVFPGPVATCGISDGLD
jgi:hypothetical protein